MSEYNEVLRKAAARPDRLADGDIAALRRACREYPADVVAPALLLKYAAAALDDRELAFARARVALYAGAPADIITAIDPSGKGFDTFYPPLPADNRPSTASAIDIFLNTYGRQSPEEDALLERMIFNPVPDYAEQLARQTPPPVATEKSAHDDLIDAFIEKHSPQEPSEPSEISEISAFFETSRSADSSETPPSTRKSPRKESAAPTPALLSQSLAKIFIKQGRYERAFEIISNLSLNYPEKSVYFADQLRFLRKLIINQRYAEQPSQNPTTK